MTFTRKTSFYLEIAALPFVLATLMAIPILREPVGPGLLLGGSLALAGVYVTERS